MEIGTRRAWGVLAAFMLALTLLVAPWAAGTALAQDPVEYLAWDEESKQLVLRKDDDACTSYTPITHQTSWGAAGQTIWYVVKEDATIGVRITVLGDVHLILCDGKKLDAYGGITVASGNSLTVYAQSEGNYAGRLSVELSGSDTGIGGASGGIVGTLTVNGGEVNASSGSGAGIRGSGAAIGGTSATVTVNGGEVDANGKFGVGIGGTSASVTVNGGTVESANGRSCGIGGDQGAVELGKGVTMWAKDGSNWKDVTFYTSTRPSEMKTTIDRASVEPPGSTVTTAGGAGLGLRGRGLGLARELVDGGWTGEGIGFYSDDAQGVAVWRLFNPYVGVGTHHYTTGRAEYDGLPAFGWVQEGVGWYALR